MRSTTMRMITVAALAIIAMACAPAAAGAGGARLYEMTENMKLTKGKFERRKATSELIGTADVGTPLCPKALVELYAPGAASCTVNATGSDNISLATGLGEFSGSFTTVVQGDNNSDSPEFVVMRGTFRGKMDFSPAILFSIPLGSVVGKITAQGLKGGIPFKGTFRLPFQLTSPLVFPDGKGGTVEIPCGASPLPGCDAAIFGAAPTPLNPMERYDLVNATRPLYLMDDMKNIAPTASSEFGGGWAAVKFEISF